jgi:hypothetical protein
VELAGNLKSVSMWLLKPALASFLVVRTASAWNKPLKAGLIAGCCNLYHKRDSSGKTGTRKNFNEPIKSLTSVLAGVPDTASEFTRGISATILLSISV